MKRRQLARAIALASVIGSMVYLSSATAQVPAAPAEYPAQFVYESTPVPDRITLTLTEDPAHSQAVSWRTDQTVATPQAQVAPLTDWTQFKAGAVTVPASESTPVQADLAFPALFHSALFTDLEPDTEYLYRVGDGANWSEWIEFTTASESDKPFSFIYFGDAQNDIKEHWSRVIRRAYSDRPDAEFIIHAGDLVNTANNDSEWAERYVAGGWIESMVPSVPTPGNHEYSGTLLSPYWQPQFALPENGPQGTGPLYDAMRETVYYLDYQNVRIISLNSNVVAAGAQSAEWWQIQADWLEGVLQDNPQEWTVVTFHHPVFANSPTRDNKALRDAWRPIFEEYGVDLVLQGHDHSYGRGNVVDGFSGEVGGVVYVVSVSGPKMYEVSDENWTANGAEQSTAIGNTQLYQLIDISDGVLRYDARTAAGESFDLFEIHIDEDGNKTFVESPDDGSPEEPDHPGKGHGRGHGHTH